MQPRVVVPFTIVSLPGWSSILAVSARVMLQSAMMQSWSPASLVNQPAEPLLHWAIFRWPGAARPGGCGSPRGPPAPASLG